MDWQPIDTAPQDGTNFLAVIECIADEYDENDRIVRKDVRERYVRVAQCIGFGCRAQPVVIPFNGGIVQNERFTHWAPIPVLPPDHQ